MLHLFVPKNTRGIESHRYGRNDDENLLRFDLTDDEFNILEKHHVFDILNDKFDLWIDYGESETVQADQLKKEYQAISLVKGTWQEAVDMAIKLGTCIYLDF